MNAKRTTTILTDADWLILKAALDEIRSKVGRPFANERRTLEAVIWRFKNDARWREIPAELGPWWRAAQLHYRWQKAGIWDRLRTLLLEAEATSLADLFGNSEELMELDDEALTQVSAGGFSGRSIFPGAMPLARWSGVSSAFSLRL